MLEVRTKEDLLQSIKQFPIKESNECIHTLGLEITYIAKVDVVVNLPAR